MFFAPTAEGLEQRANNCRLFFADLIIGAGAKITQYGLHAGLAKFGSGFALKNYVIGSMLSADRRRFSGRLFWHTCDSRQLSHKRWIVIYIYPSGVSGRTDTYDLE